MKKTFILLILVIAVMTGCNQSSTETTETDSSEVAAKAFNNAKMLNDSSIVYETLDGMPKAEALSMISNFQTNQANDSSSKVSYVIPKDMLLNIYTMLLKEKAAGVAAHKKYTTDGIRIYFGKDPQNNKQLKLILVSTTDSIPYPGDLKQTMHHDYYEHVLGNLHTPGVILGVNPEGSEDIARQQLFSAIKLGDDRRDVSCKDTTREGLITVEFAKKMVEQFNGKVLKTKAIWFGLDRFKNMLTETKFAGLRIYLAGYPYLDLTTVVLTTFNSSQVDYFDCEMASPLKNKTILKKIDDEPQNNGGLCPNNCN